MTARYDYSRWDGSQNFADLDPDDLLAELTDDLLAGGDLSDALRRLLRSGTRMPNGEELQGLRDLLEQARRRRAELLEEGNPNEELARISRELEDVIAEERDGIDELEEEAEQSGDDRRQQVTGDVASERRM